MCFLSYIWPNVDGIWGSEGKSGTSAERRASCGSAALFCLTHTGCRLLYICNKSDLTTSGQLNAKARTHAECTHWRINPRSGFSGPHSAVAWVTCRKILTSAWTQTHPWPRPTADSFRGRGEMVTDSIVVKWLSAPRWVGSRQQVLIVCEKKK